MIEPQRVGKNLAGRALDYFMARPTLFRRVLHEGRQQPFAELPVPGALAGQVVNPVDEQLGGLSREVQHGFGRHLQAICRLVVCCRALLPVLLIHGSGSTSRRFFCRLRLSAQERMILPRIFRRKPVRKPRSKLANLNRIALRKSLSDQVQSAVPERGAALKRAARTRATIGR